MPRAVERPLVVAAAVAFVSVLVAVVASSVGPVEGHLDSAVRIAMWTAAIVGFVHLALPARAAGFVSWGLWTVLAAASAAVSATDGSATIGDLPGKERVTASLGVAEQAPSESASELIRRADRSVYAAKDRGWNRVVADGVSRGADGPQGA